MAPRRRVRPAAAKTCEKFRGRADSRRSSTRRAALRPQSRSRSGSLTSARVRDGRGGAPARGFDRIRSGATVGVPISDLLLDHLLWRRPPTTRRRRRFSLPGRRPVLCPSERRSRRSRHGLCVARPPSHKNSGDVIYSCSTSCVPSRARRDDEVQHVVQAVASRRRPLDLYAVRSAATAAVQSLLSAADARMRRPTQTWGPSRVLNLYVL